MGRIRGPHDVDRDLGELLQELRVAQTGGQLFFAFLFSVAFTQRFEELTEAQRLLYGWDLFAVASATTVLVAPVAVHRWNFGHGLRPQLLIVSQLCAVAGLVLLSAGIVLGLALVSTLVFPDAPVWLPVTSAVLVVLLWVAVPWLTRRSTPQLRTEDLS